MLTIAVTTIPPNILHVSSRRYRVITAEYSVVNILSRGTFCSPNDKLWLTYWWQVTSLRDSIGVYMLVMRWAGMCVVTGSIFHYTSGIRLTFPSGSAAGNSCSIELGGCVTWSCPLSSTGAAIQSSHDCQGLFHHDRTFPLSTGHQVRLQHFSWSDGLWHSHGK